MVWLLFACAAPLGHDSPGPPAVSAPVAIAAPPPPVLPVWPAAGAPLIDVDAGFPATWTPARLLIDPGHGAPGNDGTTTIRCEAEQEFTRRTADAVMARLDGDPRLLVRDTRPDAALVPYPARLHLAVDWRADAMISLHADAREGDDPGTDPETGCHETHAAYGFAVLWSDEGEATLVSDRHRLALAVASRMIGAGFPPYGGRDYAGLYEGDPAHAGVFVDRHVPRKRVMMLRRSPVPTVIIETHQSTDRLEVARWDEPATLDAFAAVLRAAMVDYVTARAR